MIPIKVRVYASMMLLFISNMLIWGPFNKDEQLDLIKRFKAYFNRKKKVTSIKGKSSITRMIPPFQGSGGGSLNNKGRGSLGKHAYRTIPYHTTL